jgi:hypothetical protein
MRILLIAATGLLCAILGGTLAGLVGDCYTRWFHVSQREGGAGYLVAFLILAGGVAGLITGLITGVSNDTFSTGLGWGSGIIASVAAMSFALCYLLGDIPPTSGLEQLDLVAEIRAPQGVPLTNRMKANGASTRLIHVLADGSNGYSSSGHGNWTGDGVATTRMHIFASKGGWTIEVSEHGDPVATFPALNLEPMRPSETWSPWQVASNGFGLRYRIALRSEEARLREEAPADAPKQLPVLDPNGPLEPWLHFLDEFYKRPNGQYVNQEAADQLRAQAMQVIRNRPDDVVALLGRTGPGNMHQAELAVQGSVAPESLGAPLRAILPRFEEAVRLYRKESPAGDPDILRARKLQEDFQVWCNLWQHYQGFHPDVERPNLDALEKAVREAPESDPIHDLAGHIESYREFTLSRKP